MTDRLIRALAKDFLVCWLTDPSFTERTTLRQLGHEYQSLASWFEDWPYTTERTQRLQAVLKHLQEDGWVVSEPRGKRGRPRQTEPEHVPITKALWARRVLDGAGRYAESTVRMAKAALGESGSEVEKPSYYLRVTDKVFSLFDEIPPPERQTVTEWAQQHDLPTTLAKRWARREMESGRLKQKTINGRRVLVSGEKP